MNVEPTGYSQHALDDYTRLEGRFRTLQHEAYAYKRQRDALVSVLRGLESELQADVKAGMPIRCVTGLETVLTALANYEAGS